MGHQSLNGEQMKLSWEPKKGITNENETLQNKFIMISQMKHYKAKWGKTKKWDIASQSDVKQTKFIMKNQNHTVQTMMR